MSLVRDILKKHGVSFDDFRHWAEVASKSTHQRPFDSYNKSLRKIEIAHTELETFIMRWIDRPGFEIRLAKRESQVRALEQKSLKILIRIFAGIPRIRA
jgi:hypothetical protein